MSGQQESSTPNQGRRKNYLLMVLTVMVGMLAYDYRVARPSVDRAYQKIVQRTTEVNNSPARSLTNQDVQTLITKSPSRTFMDGQDLVEVYSWRSGLPVRTHDLFAVYKKSIRGEQVFYRQAKFVYETSAEVAPVPVPLLVEGTEEEIAQYNEELRREIEEEMRYFADEERHAARQNGSPLDGSPLDGADNDRLGQNVPDTDVRLQDIADELSNSSE
tara:strand:+ start:66300 stop:66950 length:651 start_codon:yes stop_codon:yes gene_type:complete